MFVKKGMNPVPVQNQNMTQKLFNKKPYYSHTHVSTKCFFFSDQIKPALITELGDKNWKVRGEALQKVIVSTT